MSLDVFLGTLALEVPPPGPWKRWGACCGLGPAAFFDRSRKGEALAKALCAECTVVHECRAYGVRYPALQGVWGGLNEDEREKVNRNGRFSWNGQLERRRTTG